MGTKIAAESGGIMYRNSDFDAAKYGIISDISKKKGGKVAFSMPKNIKNRYSSFAARK